MPSHVRASVGMIQPIWLILATGAAMMTAAPVAMAILLCQVASHKSDHSVREVNSDNDNYAIDIYVPKQCKLAGQIKGSASSKNIRSWPVRMKVQRTLF